MISIEIIDSPDEETKGLHTFHFDEITIGTIKRCKFIILDNDLNKQHLKLEVLENNLFCQPFHQKTYYLSNGKKISGRKKIKTGDELTFGNTIIKIVDFSQSDLDNTTLSQRYNEAIDNFPESEDVLEQIEKEFILIEKMTNAK